MEFGVQNCLRLQDDFGTTRWLTTRRESWQLMADGGYESERIRPIALEANLRRLVDPNNSSSGLRGFLMRAAAQSALGGYRCQREDEIVSYVMAAVQAGWLVVVRKVGEVVAGAATKARADARRIARGVDTLTKGKLRCSGRRYTLCAKGQVDRSALGLTRRLLVPREGTTVLNRMIEEYAGQRDLVALLTEARALFSTSVRSEDAELVLLRHLIQPQARKTEEAPVTPSQIRREKEGWIEIEARDDLSCPWVGRLHLVLADGSPVDTSTDEGGFMRLDGIVPGDVRVAPDSPPPTVHIVKQGECFSSIARKYNFKSYKDLYNHADNAAFREKRPDPAVIFPGDKIAIPSPAVDRLTLATGKRHRIVLKGPSVRLRLFLKDRDGQPLADLEYVLTFPGGEKRGKTSSKGLLEQPVPANLEKADVEMPAIGLKFQVRCGTIDPVDTITGVQARLNGLGFGPGPADGIVGPRTKAAIERFRLARKIEITGDLEDRTRRELVEAYGC